MGFLYVSASVFVSCAISLFCFIPSTCLFYSILFCFFLFACLFSKDKESVELDQSGLKEDLEGDE